MASRSVVTAFVLVQLLAFAVAAQQSAEFGRASGGEVVVTPKGSAPLSGSLTLSASSASDVFGAMTAGGTLVQDRLWFFASASRQQTSARRFDGLELPEIATTSALDAKAIGQLGSSQDFSAIFRNGQPSSFLSLRYTGIVSSNMFFNASFTRTK